MAISLARRLKQIGIDFIECSSGGNVAGAKIRLGSGYQVPLAERVRQETEILTGAVGLITEPTHADGIISNVRADLVLLGRESLRDHYWPIDAARAHNESRARACRR